MGRLVVAEYDGQPNNALVADGADLGCVAIPHGVDKRCDTCLDEVDTIDSTVSFIKVVLVWQRREMRPKPPVVVIGQRC
jgi:hypothetical protein